MSRVLFAAVMLAGCQDGGDLPLPDADEPDLGGDVDDVGDTPSEPDTDQPDAADVADEEYDGDCIPEASPTSSPGHNPGAACRMCHPEMTAAGTLFADPAGSTYVQGATVRLTDATGSEIDIVTTYNGNFYTYGPLSFPVSALASRCPDTAAMSAPASHGDCNQCHGVGSRINLP